MKWMLLALVILSTVLGDLLQSREMKLARERHGKMPGAASVVKLIFARRYLFLAIASMGISFFAFLALVQIEPISFAVPASAGSFVVETILAKLLLKEHLSSRKALGTVAVFAGILLVAH